MNEPGSGYAAARTEVPVLTESSHQPERLTSRAGVEGQPAFSPDGSRLVFSAPGNVWNDLFLLDPESRALEAFTNTSDVWESEPAWTPDGSGIVYLAFDSVGASLRLKPTNGGEPRTLAPASMTPRRPHVSPTGDWVAFSVSSPGRTQLWKVRTAAGEPIQVADLEHNASTFGWSHDGTAILVDWFTPDGQDLWAIDMVTGAPTRLTTHPNEEWVPAFSPAGDQAVFYSTYDRSMTDIWTIDVTDGTTRQLTSDAAEDFAPSWSPDGKRIAFLSDRVAKSGLWTVDIETGEIEGVLPRIHLRGKPIWSPQGDAIVFRRQTAPSRLYSVPAGGGVPTALTGDSIEARNPSVSPSGDVGFSTDSWGSESDLGVFDPESGSIRQLTETTDNISQVSWSPDGRWIAFRRNPGGWYRTSDAWTQSIDGTSQTQLTTSGYLRSPLWCGEYVYFHRPTNPRDAGTTALWRAPETGGDGLLVHDLPGTETPTDCHPDGGVVYQVGGAVRHATFDSAGGLLADRVLVEDGAGARVATDGRVAFVSSRDGQPDIYVLDPADGSITQITDSPWTESSPDWSPDGATLYFSATEGDTDLWWVRVETP